MSTVVRATLADQAYSDLRARILGGQIASGARLRPEDLAAELSVSPTPVKEALVRLEADGLVVSSARKGMSVRRLDVQDVTDIYDARQMIELNALDRAFARREVGPTLLDALTGHLDRHETYAKRNTLDDFGLALEADRAFHGAIVAESGNALVAEWHRRILRQTHTVFVYNVGNYTRSVDEHRLVLDALRAGSRPAARRALTKHLERSRDDTLKTVQAAGSGA